MSNVFKSFTLTVTELGIIALKPISLEIAHKPAQYIRKVAQPNCIAKEHTLISRPKINFLNSSKLDIILVPLSTYTSMYTGSREIE